MAFFAVVAVANLYMNLYSRLRVDIRNEKAVTERVEKETAYEEWQR